MILGHPISCRLMGCQHDPRDRGVTMVEKHCQQQLQEGMIEKFVEYSEGLFESSDIGAAVYPWQKKEAISPLLIEEGSGKETVEEP